MWPTIAYLLVVIGLWTWWAAAMFSDSGLGDIARWDYFPNWRTNYQNFLATGLPGFAYLVTIYPLMNVIQDHQLDTLRSPPWLAVLIKILLVFIFVTGVLAILGILMSIFWWGTLPWWMRADKRWQRRQDAKLDVDKQAAAEARPARKFDPAKALRADQIEPVSTLEPKRERRYLEPGLGEATVPYWKAFVLGLAVYLARHLYRWALSDAAAAIADTVHYLAAGAVFLGAIYYFVFRFRVTNIRRSDPRKDVYQQLSAAAQDYYHQLSRGYDYYAAHPEKLDQSLLTLDELQILEMSDAEVSDHARRGSDVSTTPGQLTVAVIGCLVMLLLVTVLPLYGVNVIEGFATLYWQTDL